MTPRELLDKAQELLLAKDMSGFADLWATDGTMEFPFAPPGWPTRLDGREAVREYLSGYTDVFDIKRFTALTVHETTDPEVIVVEMEVEGLMVRTGETYQRRYISVITVRDGHIAGYRDYWSPLGMTAETDFTVTA
ncbi:nuclear transport factor 2 family protein [Kibdelosporangium persicum]|uniref:Phenazine biosynthesis protein PhzA/PhzB n=1 Tax=Kibdelosporangium persicum TaxID=2698649 RepID=A0ABX2FJ39_9PSEU|nr:nuclear transport factor 2 family protein [Kibdelosporangium persicum]NRN70786.1 Phenazine biosynthesis protein PhzA/PhzB [Kibdelosporangium persicum]